MEHILDFLLIRSWPGCHSGPRILQQIPQQCLQGDRDIIFSSFHHILIITNIIIVALRSYNKYHNNNNNNAIMTRTPWSCARWTRAPPCSPAPSSSPSSGSWLTSRGSLSLKSQNQVRTKIMVNTDVDRTAKLWIQKKSIRFLFVFWLGVIHSNRDKQCG